MIYDDEPAVSYEEDPRDWTPEPDAFALFRDAVEGYCDLCEVVGHMVQTCPMRDDEPW